MPNIKKLTVVSSKLTTKGTYLNKFVTKNTRTVSTAFGANTQESKETYYMFTDQSNEVGKVGDLDLDYFDIVREVVSMEIDGEIKDLTLKKLYPKK